MEKVSKAWLLDVIEIEDIPGFNPNNIHFSAKIWGPRGKGRIAKSFGLAHMIDDKDEALLSVYEALQKRGAKFPSYGQLFHFARSGSGTRHARHGVQRIDLHKSLPAEIGTKF